MLNSVKERIAQYGIVADALRFIRRTDRGKPNGVASLDNDGLIPVVQLPSAAIVEKDPTVPAWAKEPERPTYTAGDVGADAEGTADRLINVHNESNTSHSDIRILINELSTTLTNFLGVSSDATKTLSDILSLIADAEESGEIAALTNVVNNKVNYGDIINNLTTSLENKALSAAQGVALKQMYDTINSDYVPKATYNALDAKVKTLETQLAAVVDALGGLTFRGSNVAPSGVDENRITFVDLTL